MEKTLVDKVMNYFKKLGWECEEIINNNETTIYLYPWTKDVDYCVSIATDSNSISWIMYLSSCYFKSICGESKFDIYDFKFENIIQSILKEVKLYKDENIKMDKEDKKLLQSWYPSEEEYNIALKNLQFSDFPKTFKGEELIK